MLGLRTTCLVLLPALTAGFLAPTPALRYVLVLFPLLVMTMLAAPSLRWLCKVPKTYYKHPACLKGCGRSALTV